jgi:hypothetical protein
MNGLYDANQGATGFWSAGICHAPGAASGMVNSVAAA